MRLLACVIAAACAAAAPAASVQEVLETVAQNLTPEELQEPGSQARAKAIAEMLHGDLGLSASDLVDLKLALAEAWLDALAPDQADEVIGLVLGDAAISPAQRERAGLAWVASWQLRLKTASDPTKLASPLEGIKRFGELGPRVAARTHVAEAQRLLTDVGADGKPHDPAAVLAQFDQALALLKDQPTEERVPVYHLRLLAMEAAGQKPEDVQQWLKEHQSDPAAAEVADTALTGEQKLVGQPAPPLKLKRIDGTDQLHLKDGRVIPGRVVAQDDKTVTVALPGQERQVQFAMELVDKVVKADAQEVDLSTFKGKPVLLDFFATWCKPCEAIAPAVAAFAVKHQGEMAVIGVSLDTKDTVKEIPAWIAAHGIAYPLVGDLLGWDGEVADAWHVDHIPTLVLIGPDGRVATADLVGKSDEDTLHNLEAALAPFVKGGAAGGGGEGVPP
jgi:thiol-disulfide isomerase/thioredoxin